MNYEDAIRKLKSYSRYYNGRGKKYPQGNCPVSREDITAAIATAVECVSRCKREDRKNGTRKDSGRLVQGDVRDDAADATGPVADREPADVQHE